MNNQYDTNSIHEYPLPGRVRLEMPPLMLPTIGNATHSMPEHKGAHHMHVYQLSGYAHSELPLAKLRTTGECHLMHADHLASRSVNTPKSRYS